MCRKPGLDSRSLAPSATLKGKGVGFSSHMRVTFMHLVNAASCGELALQASLPFVSHSRNRADGCQTMVCNAYPLKIFKEFKLYTDVLSNPSCQFHMRQSQDKWMFVIIQALVKERTTIQVSSLLNLPRCPG